MSRETIYYYTPQKSADDRLLTNVALSMGIRFRRIEKSQLKQQIGYIAGLPGFSAAKNEAGGTGTNNADAEIGTPAGDASEGKEPASGSADAENEPAAGSAPEGKEPAAGGADAENEPAAGSAPEGKEPAAGGAAAESDSLTDGSGDAVKSNEPAEKVIAAADPAESGPEIPDKILIMQGFSRRRLDEFLRAMRRKKVPAIPLKAILTETNSTWTVTKLYRELYKENAYMTGQKNKEE